MKHRTTKTVLILSATLLTVSASAYGYMFLIFNDLIDNIPKQYSADAQSKATLAELIRVEQNLKDTLASKDRLSALFVRQEKVADFIQTIEAMIRQAHLTGSVDSVSDNDIEEGNTSNKTKLAVSLTANGEWQEVVRLSGLIEKLPYKSVVDSVSFSPLGQGQDVSDKKIQPIRGWKVLIKMHVLMIKSKDTLEK